MLIIATPAKLPGVNKGRWRLAATDIISETPQILLASNYGLQGFNIDDGRILWQHPWDIEEPRCVRPQCGRGIRPVRRWKQRLPPASCYKNNDAWTVEGNMVLKKFSPYFNNGILYKDHYYGYDDVRLGCIAMETGERAWSGERYGGQLTFIEAMEMLLVLSERGDLALVRAVPDRFEEVARVKALTGKTWNHPIIHRGRLYVRNSQEAACFELPGLVAAP